MHNVLNLTTKRKRRRRTTTTRRTTTLRRRRRPEGPKGGPKGLILEVGAQRAPELLVVDN